MYPSDEPMIPTSVASVRLQVPEPREQNSLPDAGIPHLKLRRKIIVEKLTVPGKCPPFPVKRSCKPFQYWDQVLFVGLVLCLMHTVLQLFINGP